MKLYLIDGTWELFRHYYGAPGATDSAGREVGATRGLLRSLQPLLASGEATFIAAAFDTEIRSFRNDLFAGYKTGEGIEPKLLNQFPLVERAAAALGITVWPMRTFETDDALATAASRLADQVSQVRICSPDKDFAQCVTGDRVVLWDRKRATAINEAGVIDKWGIAPASMPDWLALVGDTADGIPGLPGWGAKTTSAVLARYHHLEAIPDDPDAWDVPVRGAARLAGVLAERRDDALLYRTLATLRRDVPLAETLDELRYTGPDMPVLRQLCDEIGLSRFADQVERAGLPRE